MCMREVKSDDRKKLHAETPPLEALKKGVEEPWTVERVTKFADLRLGGCAQEGCEDQSTGSLPLFKINAVLDDTKMDLKPPMNQLKELIESERKMTKVHSMQSKGHRPWIIDEHQNIEQEVAPDGSKESCCQHDPRHVDVIAKNFGLERGNSARTATFDVTIEPGSTSPMPVASRQMPAPQTR